MSLKLRAFRSGEKPETGYAVVGEKLTPPYNELLLNVWPLDDKASAVNTAENLEAKKVDGKSWLVVPVSLVGIVETEHISVMEYVQVSHLTNPEFVSVA